ncbi:hypothetical protein [Jiella pacifica]|uniref:Uncharacterized protein n=1 Tax=Jiella pacifica TaxID=2696469 RepID=A0A6N9SZ43_9HYPH|nr:hypothetical protein [Jiella pacifica]NDW04360.1 hypothetical protein [Jiella pacifica]
MTLLASVSLIVGIAAGVRGSLSWAVVLSLALLLTGGACELASGFSFLAASAIAFGIMGIFQAAFALAAVLAEVATRKAARRELAIRESTPLGLFSNAAERLN